MIWRSVTSICLSLLLICNVTGTPFNHYNKIILTVHYFKDANNTTMVPSLVPVVTTSSYGNSIAGSVYTLVCMVKVVDGLVVVPDVVWMKDGGVLVNGTNIILTRTVSGGNSTLNLTFNPLLTSYGGQYICAANKSDQNVTNSLAVNVSVQSVFNIKYSVTCHCYRTGD